MSTNMHRANLTRRTRFPSFEFQRVVPDLYASTPPRPLLPLSPPPEYLTLYPPALPSSPRSRESESPFSLLSEFTLTTHVIPAAYPRTTPAVRVPPDLEAPLPPESTKAQRAERNRRVFELIRETKTAQVNGEYPPDVREQRVLWNCVNRYRRRRPAGIGRNSITLLLFHANGFPKETFEPFLAHLTSKLQNSSGSVSVDDIWAFEAVNHGDAALINKDKLGFLYDWSDNTRDILHFLRYYLPSSNVESGALPVHLLRLPESVSDDRLAHGFKDRTIIALGHSFGGCTVTYAAIHAPKLFKSLILVDPVIGSPFTSRKDWLNILTKGAISRRDEWSSREEAHKLFTQSPFFSAWDPASLKAYVDFGLYDDTSRDGKSVVRLKTRGIDEAMVFFEHKTSRETYECLKELDPDVKLHWVIAGRDPVGGPEEVVADIVWRRPENASNVIVQRSGHLIVQEAPAELAEAVYLFLTEELYSMPNARL